MAYFLGLSTIQSLRLQRYRADENPSDLQLLKSDPVLRQLPSLENMEDFNGIIIEDWVCPGVERLVLPWIESTLEEFGPTDSVKVACEHLASLLNRNWVKSFDGCVLKMRLRLRFVLFFFVVLTKSGIFCSFCRCTLAYAVIEEAGRERRISLRVSSWLRALRKRKWLTLTTSADHSDSVVVAAAATENFQSMDFVASPAVYAPHAFEPDPCSLVPATLDLISSLCPIWKPFQTTLASGLLTALGIRQHLDEYAFQASHPSFYSRKTVQ